MVLTREEREMRYGVVEAALFELYCGTELEKADLYAMVDAVVDQVEEWEAQEAARRRQLKELFRVGFADPPLLEGEINDLLGLYARTSMSERELDAMLQEVEAELLEGSAADVELQESEEA